MTIYLTKTEDGHTHHFRTTVEHNGVEIVQGIFYNTIDAHFHKFETHEAAETHQKELVAASSVPLVLSILTEGDRYGYAIIQRVKELSGGKIEWTDGMLYPVLHWLEDQDLVESRWEDSETGRKRKYYALKSQGRKALRQQKEQWALVNSVLNQLWNPHHA